MPIETGVTISQLDRSWPLSNDPVLEGDDHLRLIKSVLKTQFPGANGNGFEKVIESTEDELNYSQGLTGNIQQQINAILSGGTLPAPTGTVMLFQQAIPPVGWTQNVSNDDAMLRVVATTGGSSGGTDSPISFDFTHTHETSFTTLTIDQIPAHSHEINFETREQDVGSSGTSLNSTQTPIEFTATSQTTGGGQGHNHGDTDEFSANFSPKYVDVISATKD